MRYRAFRFHAGETPDTVVSGLTIQGGEAPEEDFEDRVLAVGGAILCRSSSPLIERCVITDNYAFDAGGAVYADEASSPIVSDCTISWNEAFNAGGIHCGANTQITNCELYGNGSLNVAGAIACTSGSPKITNCLVFGNSSYESGGIRCTRSNAVITNCTVADNSCLCCGGLVSLESNPTVTNCIFWRQSCIVGSATVNYSDVQGGHAGEGNIDADPLYVSGPQGDFYLSHKAAGQPADSPCVDAGSGRAVTFFRAGTTRTDLLTDAGIVDMGYHGNATLASACTPADFDGDGDVDQDDHAGFESCASGPAIPHDGSEICQIADFDTDGDVDQSDFGIFQRCISSGDRPGDPTCAG
jgi:hypothetical protein